MQLQNCSVFCRVFASRRSCLLPVKSAVLAMPGRRECTNSTAKIIIYNVYQYFQETAKNKYQGPLKLTSKTAKATGYSERTVRNIVAEKTKLDGAAFMSLPKCYRRERKVIDPDHFDTMVLQRAEKGEGYFFW